MKSSDDWALTFGDLDWSPIAQPEGKVAVDVIGLRRGKAVPVVVTVESLVRDGGLERVESYGNRDQSLILALSSSDPTALAEYERRLWLEVAKPANELVWSPPGNAAPSCVYDILWSDLEFTDADEWDLDELRGKRLFVLTLRAAPFVRSVKESIIPALVAGTATPLTISDGTSATGWTGTTAVTVSSGTLAQGVPTSNRPTGDYGGGTISDSTGDFIYTPASAIDLSNGRSYVSVDYLPLQTANRNAIEMFADGVSCPLVAEQGSPVNSSWRRATFLCSDQSVAVLRFRLRTYLSFYPTGTTAPTAVNRFIDNVTASSTPPGNSTGRQSIRRVEVGGAARSPGSLSVQHPTAGLGDVLVYVAPELAVGYTPDLRRWRTAATGTADAATVSGFREVVSTSGTTFSIPSSLLAPGAYALVMRARYVSGTSNASVAFQVSTATRIGGVAFESRTMTAAPFVPGTDFANFTLGAVSLPTVSSPLGSAGSVEVTVTAPGAVTSTEFDEMWLFRLGDDTSLTSVACGTGTPAQGVSHNRLWLDSASLDSPLPGIYMGTLPDRSDAFHAGSVAAWSVPTYTPPAVKAFVVTSGAVNAMVDLRHFARWPFHAAS